MPTGRSGSPARFKMLLGGEWVAREDVVVVKNPYSQEHVGEVPSATVDDVRHAIARAQASVQNDFPLSARYEVLMKAAALVEARRDEYARTIALEGSKTIRESQREPVRTANLLRLSAEEGRRLTGETLPFESRIGSENRVGYYFRFPVGVVVAITPFNDPLAMAGHNIGPAIAAGNALVLKPSVLTPLSVLMLAEDLVAAGLPKGRLSIVTGHGNELGEALAGDERVRLVTFTGGVETGLQVSRWLGVKKVLMELGSNSPVLVMEDANLTKAIPAIAAGAYAQAGENCLGVQRILVHESIYEDFRSRFVGYVSRLRAGYSMDPETDVCAMITEREARRVESWITDAIRHGATLLVGGKREDTVITPAVLENVPKGVKMHCEEIYGPVASLYRFTTLDEAIAMANETQYGLHAAIFTERIDHAFRAIRSLNCGAVIVNDSTDYRLDVMPFGGTRMSGVGRQGIWSMIREMTETRVVCFNL